MKTVLVLDCRPGVCTKVGEIDLPDDAREADIEMVDLRTFRVQVVPHYMGLAPTQHAISFEGTRKTEAEWLLAKGFRPAVRAAITRGRK